jgi:tankyrase
MKHPLFKSLGNDYPVHLEKNYDRILQKIEALWEQPEIHDYFSDLLIDKRGGRKGFSNEVLNEIVLLREFHEFRTFREAERKEDAIQALERRGVALNKSGFFQAIHAGDQEVTDLFVRANFNVNSADEQGTPALMVALKKGYTIVAKILVEGGADVNTRDRLGLTPLLIACGKSTYGFKAVAELLVERGAAINVRDSLGYTPLLLSLSGGTIGIAKLLIERGADVLACTRRGETALLLSEKHTGPEGIEIMALLQSKGVGRDPVPK